MDSMMEFARGVVMLPALIVMGVWGRIAHGIEDDEQYLLRRAMP